MESELHFVLVFACRANSSELIRDRVMRADSPLDFDADLVRQAQSRFACMA